MIRSLKAAITLFCILSSVPAFSQTLVLAQLSERPKKDFKELRPMVAYMAEKLAPYGITSGQVRLFSELDDLIKAIKNGEVHWVTETPFTTARLVYEAKAIPLLRKWKSGQQSYVSLIYTRKDSGINSLADLIGKKIALEHDQSFSSYFIPRIELAKRGIATQLLENPNLNPAVDKAGLLLSRNEKNNILWVHKKIVDAGVINNDDWNNPSRMPPSFTPDLKVIYRSEPKVRAFELVSSTLSTELTNALKQELLSMHIDSHKDILGRYERTTQFEEINTDTRILLREIYTLSNRW